MHSTNNISEQKIINHILIQKYTVHIFKKEKKKRGGGFTANKLQKLSPYF